MRYSSLHRYWNRNRSKRIDKPKPVCTTLSEQNNIYIDLFSKTSIPVADSSKIRPYKISKKDPRKRSGTDYVQKSIVVPSVFEGTTTTKQGYPKLKSPDWIFTAHNPIRSAFIYQLPLEFDESFANLSKKYEKGSPLMKERRKWCKPRFKFNSDRNHEFSDLESEGSATSSASSKRHNHDSGNSSESSLEHSDSCTFSSDASPNDSDAIQVSPAEEISSTWKGPNLDSGEMNEDELLRKFCFVSREKVFLDEELREQHDDSQISDRDDDDVLTIGLTSAEYREF